MRRYVPLARKVNLNAMLPGEAPVAVRLFADIRLYRADGVEAFSDITAEATQQRNNVLVAAAIFVGMVLVTEGVFTPLRGKAGLEAPCS